MTISKQDVGVWVKASEELPENNYFIPIKINGRYDVSTFLNRKFRFDFSDDVYDKENYDQIEWLKPIKDVYVLDKQKLKDFFDAGYDYRSSLTPDIIDEYGEGACPNFETFLSEYNQ